VLDIAKLLRPTLGEQIEIDSILEPEVATAHIDASQLANSLLNMAINARDAMPEGGKLLLETRNVVLDEAYAAGQSRRAAGPLRDARGQRHRHRHVQEVLDKVFEPFFTTKEVGKGSGLGLSMVYGFVKQSGGHIRIYSEDGHGTTIKLYLPPARGQSRGAPAAPRCRRQRNHPGGGRRRAGAQFRHHAVAEPRLPHGRRRQRTGGAEPDRTARQFDLLFTDVIMPGGMSGRAAGGEGAKLRPGIKVLYTSGYTDNAIVHQGRLDPACCC
jgi:hypothetical protein